MEIQEARQLLLKHAQPIRREKEEIVISKAMGRVVASDITSPFSVPSFPKSAMDGYAVRAAELAEASGDHPVRLKVIGELMAGDYREIAYEPGSAVRVMTGAYVPEGYDAVVKQEDTDYGEETVEIFRAITEYTNYCKVGEDIAEGVTVIRENTVLTRAHVGMLASLGFARVPVRPVPVVGILCTGSELLTLEEKPRPGKIYNSISYMLSASLEQFGIPCRIRVCTDDADLIRQELLALWSECDVILTTGGVSVGKKDLLPRVLESMGAERLFAGVNIKPGTPTMASLFQGRIILSLSGNPYAALCNFDYYFWDLAARISGNDHWKNQFTTAILTADYPKKEPTRRFLRARLKEGRVTPEQKNASSVISNMEHCNCYILIDGGREYRENDEVLVMKMK